MRILLGERYAALALVITPHDLMALLKVRVGPRRLRIRKIRVQVLQEKCGHRLRNSAPSQSQPHEHRSAALAKELEQHLVREAAAVAEQRVGVTARRRIAFPLRCDIRRARLGLARDRLRDIPAHARGRRRVIWQRAIVSRRLCPSVPQVPSAPEPPIHQRVRRGDQRVIRSLHMHRLALAHARQC